MRRWAHSTSQSAARCSICSGIRRQVIFSSFSSGVVFGCKDLEVRYGGVRAFNRAMKAFVADDPRLVGVGLMVFEDPERSVAELERALATVCGSS